MGSKNNPGNFDCYSKADPDEPMFVLLGRDRRGAFLTYIWAHVSDGDFEAAEQAFNDLLTHCQDRKRTNRAKVIEAIDCANAMQHWADES